MQGYRQGSAARGFRYIVPHVSYSPGSRSYCSLNKSRKNPKSFSMADRASVTRPTEPTLESQFQGPHTSEQLPVHLTGRDREYFTISPTHIDKTYIKYTQITCDKMAFKHALSFWLFCFDFFVGRHLGPRNNNVTTLCTIFHFRDLEITLQSHPRSIFCGF